LYNEKCSFDTTQQDNCLQVDMYVPYCVAEGEYLHNDCCEICKSYTSV